MRRYGRWVCAGVLLLSPLGASAEPPPAATPPAAAPVKKQEFAGIGKATLGMKYDEVHKLFPKAEPVKEGEDLGAATVPGPYVTRLVLREQKVEGLAKPTMVELRFWKKKLWAVIVYFGDNDDQKVMAMLEQRLGPSGSKDPVNQVWKGDNVHITVQTKQRWYSFTDDGLSAEAQAWFGKLLRGEWKGLSEDEKAEYGTPPGGAPAKATAPATPAAAPPAK